jgi:hypothetical protein
MLERRKEQRWPVYLGGRLAFPFDRTTCDCLVRNTSARGARLVMRQAWCLPREFSLQIPSRQVDIRMRARWHRSLDLGFEIGLEAIAAQPAEPIDLELERNMRALDVHNAALKASLAELNENSV